MSFLEPKVLVIWRMSSKLKNRQATPSVARAIGGHRMKIEETVYKDFLAELNRNIASLIPGSMLASPMLSLMQCVTP